MTEDLDALRWAEIDRSFRETERVGGAFFIEAKYRFLADLQGVFIVVYFFILTYFIPIQRTVFNIPQLFLRSLVYPLILSFPWLLIYYLGINRWANTYKIIDAILSRLGNYYRVFYLTNALVIYLVFIIPLATPLLTFISLLYLILKLVSYLKKRAIKALILISLLLSYIAITVLFFEDFVFIYFNFMFRNVIPVMLNLWITNIEYLYVGSLILAASSSLSSFLTFIYEGASQVDPRVKVPKSKIQFIQISFIFTLVMIQFIIGFSTVLFLIAITSLSILEGVIRWVKKLRKENEVLGIAGRWVSWLVYFTFVAIELSRNVLKETVYLQMLPIGLGALYFLLIFIYAYIKAG